MAVNWCIFGSSGHETRPDGGVLKNFTMRAEDNFGNNRNIKSICDPTKVLAAHVHRPSCFYNGFHEADEDGDIVPGSFTREVHFSKIRINHYFTKSKEEFSEKMKRGRGHNPGSHSMAMFYEMDQNVVRDTEILSKM